MMNIISGKAKGVILETPKSNIIRPTGIRARQSLFDSLGDLSGIIFVDLFAGTGAMGLEAASRGAAEVYFVEDKKDHGVLISRNIAKVKKSGVKSLLEVIQADAKTIYRQLPELRGKVNIIFADPPYDLANEVINRLINDMDFFVWAENAIFIFEASAEISRKPVLENHNLWGLKNRSKLGQSIFYILKPKIGNR